MVRSSALAGGVADVETFEGLIKIWLFNWSLLEDSQQLLLLLLGSAMLPPMLKFSSSRMTAFN